MIPSFHNSLYNSLLNCFLEPIFHRSYIHSKDFRLLHGILFREVRRKHVEVIGDGLFQVFVYGIAANACGEEAEGSYVAMVGIE